MAKSLDFTKLKKQYFTVTLPNEERTVLMIGIPTKKTLEEFITVKETLTSSEDENALETVYGVVAKLMNHNKGGVKVTREMLEETLDFEDLIIFINAYTEFIKNITSAKN